jgi:hypothetical protein
VRYGDGSVLESCTTSVLRIPTTHDMHLLKVGKIVEISHGTLELTLIPSAQFLSYLIKCDFSTILPTLMENTWVACIIFNIKKFIKLIIW